LDFNQKFDYGPTIYIKWLKLWSKIAKIFLNSVWSTLSGSKLSSSLFASFLNNNGKCS